MAKIFFNVTSIILYSASAPLMRRYFFPSKWRGPLFKGFQSASQWVVGYIKFCSLNSFPLGFLLLFDYSSFSDPSLSVLIDEATSSFFLVNKRRFLKVLFFLQLYSCFSSKASSAALPTLFIDSTHYFSIHFKSTPCFASRVAFRLHLFICWQSLDGIS